MRPSLYDFCRRNGRSGLLDQWDTERNGADTPRTVSYGSQRKIWWRCEKGHTWQAQSTVGPAGRAAPTARAGGWDRVTTLPPCIRRWPPNGTCGKTHRGSRPTFWRGATALRGGSAKGAIPGRRPSIPGCPAADVRSARGGWWWRGKIPWRMPRQSWRPNGTRSGTPP